MAKIVERRWIGAAGAERRAWQVDFVDQHGKRRRKQFQRRKDADPWLVSARAQTQCGTFTADSASATLGEAIEAWLQRARSELLEAGTVAQYLQLAVHVRALMPASTKLARITQANVEQFRDAALDTHGRAMARKVLAALKAVVKDSQRRGLVAQNVARDTTIGAAKRHKVKLKAGVDFPLPGEVRALLDAGAPKAKAIVALAALAGLRASELRALRWCDLDLGKSPSVTIAQRADRWATIGSPKSESGRRTIPLGQTAAHALREWKLAQPGGRVLVFGTAKDRPDMLGNLQRRLLTPLCAKAGVPRFSWHALRHYAVSAWLQSCGGDFKLVQTWAGHGTLSQTLDRYGHLIPRDDREVIAATERALVT
jgi:integrase